MRFIKRCPELASLGREPGSLCFLFICLSCLVLILLKCLVGETKVGGAAALLAFVYLQSSFSCSEQVRKDEKHVVLFSSFFFFFFSPPLIKLLQTINSKRYLQGCFFGLCYQKADLFVTAARRL